MLRNLVKLGQSIACRQKSHHIIQLKYGHRLLLPRQFSSEITANWPDAIKSFLDREQISQPTSIQEKTLPLAMQNKDLVGIARTGSGKTLAFVIPAVMKILKERESDNRYTSRLPTCLVLAPTRELANQTADVFRKFRNLGINSIVLVGGASRSEQMRQLQDEDKDVYIATPGRLLDLMDSGIIDLSNIKYLVFDEADRMLDMGFEPQIRKVVERIPKNRQTLMWSATWPEEIQNLAQDFMNNYEYVAVDSEKLKANPNIEQIVEVCDPYDRIKRLIEHLHNFKQTHENPRVLIFSNTKRLADGLIIQLMKNRFRAISMHGDKTQRQREDALRLFKNGSCNIMVATDVAARGLDISDITHVINYDLPSSIEDYIHRIGRTARHDKKGTSVSFFTPNNVNIVSKLIRVLQETGQNVPEQLEQFAKNKHLYSDTSMRVKNPSRRRMDGGYVRGGYRNDRGYDRNYDHRGHDSFDRGYNQPTRQRLNAYEEFVEDNDDVDQQYSTQRRARNRLFEDRD